MTGAGPSAMNRPAINTPQTADPDRGDTGPHRDVNDLLTSGAVRSCYNANRQQAQRPHCEQLATVVYGPIALCAACDRRRSTVAKGTTRRHLPDPRPLTRIRPARRAVQTAEAELAATVTAARAAGHPWSAIAAALGISRQAAQQRFTPNQHRPPPHVKNPLTTGAAAHGPGQSSTPAPSDRPTTPPDHDPPPPHVKDPLTTQAGAGNHTPPSPPAPGDRTPGHITPPDLNPPLPPPGGHPSPADTNPPPPPEHGDNHTPIPVNPAPLVFAPCPGHHRGDANPTSPAHTPPDPALLADIDLARHALDHAHAALLTALTAARAAGHPWSAIANALAPPGQLEQQHLATPT